MWDKYYAECHAIIYVVDSVDVERIDESVAAFRKMISNEHLNGVPLLLLANKQDLPGRPSWCIERNDKACVSAPGVTTFSFRLCLGCLHPDDLKDRFKETQSLIGAREMQVNLLYERLLLPVQCTRHSSV